MIEAFVLALIIVIAGCFAVEILLANPSRRDRQRADPAADRREPVRRDRHAGRDGDAAQSVSALGAGADAADRRDASRRSARRAGST